MHQLTNKLLCICDLLVVLLSIYGPCRALEIHTEKSLISDDRRDGRKLYKN
uniref:Uncharacterized protein n=1 Tax=Octopus bimaculoides TaxID=37653 RepID=A0A0L8I389_OCTBM